MEISFINVSIPYKIVTFTLFSELPACAVSQNNQLNIKIPNIPKRHILGWISGFLYSILCSKLNQPISRAVELSVLQSFLSP